MYFPFCWKTCIHTVNIFSKFATSENANLKNYVLYMSHLCTAVPSTRRGGKPKLILFGTRQLLSKIPDVIVPFLAQNLVPVPSVKDLGIILDSNLTFNEHVNSLTLSLPTTLCQISRVRHLSFKSVLFTILNCFVFSKLSYCSTVWSGTFKQNIDKLQLPQNFAARLLTNTRTFDHI